MGNMAFFRGGGYRRWLPPEISSADEAVLVRRCWELLVLDSGGAARLERRDVPVDAAIIAILDETEARHERR